MRIVSVCVCIMYVHVRINMHVHTYVCMHSMCYAAWHDSKFFVGCIDRKFHAALDHSISTATQMLTNHVVEYCGSETSQWSCVCTCIRVYTLVYTL